MEAGARLRYSRSGGFVTDEDANVRSGEVVEVDPEWYPLGYAPHVKPQTLLKVRDAVDGVETWVDARRVEEVS